MSARLNEEIAPTSRMTATREFRMAPIYWLALGAFAVGTEAFMISAILGDISESLSVTLQGAGQLVVVFSLTYAVSSPVLTALTGGVHRRKLLIYSMAAFSIANLLASAAPGYLSLVLARVLLAMFAGLYVPSANALAGALAPPERRGRALAIVSGGVSAAVALGVPIGAIIGTHFGWRMTFVGVAFLAAFALIGLLIGLPKHLGSELPVAGLRERVDVIRQPGVFRELIVTTLWACGGYTMYTYVSPYLGSTVGLHGKSVGYALFLYGLAAFTGLQVGGAANDRVGAPRVIAIKLPIMAGALISLTVWAKYLTMAQAMVPVLVSLFVWGFAAWGFFPAQQTRLLGIAGVRVAPVILSLNASFMYLGFSAGAALGAFTLTVGGVTSLGAIGALCVLASLTLFWRNAHWQSASR